VQALHDRLESDELLLLSGDRLTSRRLRQLGMPFGMSDGAKRVHSPSARARSRARSSIGGERADSGGTATTGVS
jgi:hypothetical protein